MLRSRGIAAFLVLATLVFAAGCGDDDDGGGGGGGSTTSGSADSAKSPGEGKPPVTIGTKDFTEQLVLGELYAQALEAKGYQVNLKTNIGSTEITDKALTSKEIDAYPEYTGVSLTAVFGNTEPTKSPEETAELVKDAYEERGQVVSSLTPFQDTDSLAVTKEFGEKNNLTTVADLKKLDSFKLGAPPEFKDRQTGLKGLKEVYGIDNAEFKGLAIGIQYTALDKGDVDAANVFSTDAQLASGKYQVLEDPKGVFGYQNVYFVMNKDAYEKAGGPEFMKVIDSVNELLTEEAMRTMNSAVDIDKKDPGDVAKQFLEANGLL
jgi:osmoprotectant transport system substrate-binding protein